MWQTVNKKSNQINRNRLRNAGGSELRVPERWERHLMIESFGIHLRATDRLSSVTMKPLNRLERTMTGGIIAMAVPLEGARALG